MYNQPPRLEFPKLDPEKPLVKILALIGLPQCGLSHFVHELVYEYQKIVLEKRCKALSREGKNSLKHIIVPCLIDLETCDKKSFKKFIDDFLNF
jgi:hypothetical protein